MRERLRPQTLRRVPGRAWFRLQWRVLGGSVVSDAVGGLGRARF